MQKSYAAHRSLMLKNVCKNGLEQKFPFLMEDAEEK